MAEQVKHNRQLLKKLFRGGKKLRAERKNVNAFDFVCEARFFIALNNYLNLTDEATRAKMLYIPMRGNLSRKECEPYHPDMTNQDEKDYLFNVLLGYLQQVFNNYTTTGEYFSKSTYIDRLQSEAEFKTSDLLNELQSWIDETEPFKDYPLGQLLSDENKSLMLASHYYYKFKEYQSFNNSRITITQLIFRTKISEVSSFKCLDNAKDNGKSYNFVLVPKQYNNTAVNTYADYKQAILLEQAQRSDTTNIIELNTKTKINRVISELGQTNKRGVHL